MSNTDAGSNLPDAAELGTDSDLGSGSSRWLQAIYLLLALSGAVLPWLANLDFMRLHAQPFDIGLFLQLANANPAAQSLSRDLLVGASAVTLWMIIESRRLGMRGIGWVLVGSLTIAFAFGAPLFLFLRERRLQELRASQLGKAAS